MKRVLLPLVQAILFITTFFLVPSSISNAQPTLGFSTFIGSGLSGAVDLKHAGDGSGRLFIVEQQGRVRIHNGTLLLPTPFLDIDPLVLTSGERGLLGIAFHPDYESNRYFFVYYNNNSGDLVIARYQAQAGNPNLADPASARIMMTISKPFDNHNGGDMNFGPDGMLYIGTGDGGSGGDPNNLSQNGLSLLGKMMRIDVNDSTVAPYYSVPAGNPYTSDPAVDDRIWAIGLRNPWRWSFDRLTGDLWLADVGQGAREEVNFRVAGASGPINYGWRCYEGTQPYNTTGCLAASNYTFPIFEYPHVSATGGFSITGGYVYRGAEYPTLQGYYICADYVSGNVWLIRPDGIGGWTNKRQGALPGNISAFGEAENGTLYAVNLGGIVYKVDTVIITVLPVSLLSFSGSNQNGYNELKWNIAAGQQLDRFIVEYSMDGISWTQAGQVNAATGQQLYAFTHYTNESRKMLYRLRIDENNGDHSFSAVITLNGKTNDIRVFPTIVNNGLLQVVSETPVSRVDILDNNGALVYSQHTGGQQGYFTIRLPVLSRGMYWIKLQSLSGYETRKIVIDK